MTTKCDERRSDLDCFFIAQTFSGSVVYQILDFRYLFIFDATKVHTLWQVPSDQAFEVINDDIQDARSRQVLVGGVR